MASHSYISTKQWFNPIKILCWWLPGPQALVSGFFFFFFFLMGACMYMWEASKMSFRYRELVFTIQTVNSPHRSGEWYWIGVISLFWRRFPDLWALTNPYRMALFPFPQRKLHLFQDFQRDSKRWLVIFDPCIWLFLCAHVSSPKVRAFRLNFSF